MRDKWQKTNQAEKGKEEELGLQLPNMFIEFCDEK